MNYELLSKEISYALRHNPAQYGLVLDQDGWVALNCLLKSVQNDHRFIGLTETDIVKMIALSNKKRHEIKDGKIRAVYGHSLIGKINHEAMEPPIVLYHGTARKFIVKILNEGIISKSRQYVHLSEDVATAIDVGMRRDAKPVVLKIDAFKAHTDGVRFYCTNGGIWLADFILPEYIELT